MQKSYKKSAKKNTLHLDLSDNFTPNQLTTITGVDIRTARRWLNGKQTMHKAYILLLALYIEERILPTESGLKCPANAGIIQPTDSNDTRDRVEFGAIRSIYWIKSQNERLKCENRQLKTERETLQSQAQSVAATDHQGISHKTIRNK